MKNRDFVKDKIKRYKELKADIKYRELKLEEIEENIIGITAMPSGEKTGATYKVTSQTEIQAIKYSEDTSEIRKEIRELKREVEKIDNAMSVLNDKEKEIIQAIYIDNKSRATIQNRYYIGYQAVKKIEWTALDKMEKYLLQNKK